MNWDVYRYIASYIELGVEIMQIAERADVADYVKQLIDNVDSIVSPYPDMGYPEQRLTRYLLEHNVVIRIDERFTKLSNIPTREPWIGRRWSFQAPIYYWVLKTVFKRGKDVKPIHVLEEIREELGYSS